MKGQSAQCCMCITGVFMFLGGVIMLAIGITLILNYGFIDESLLPPDLQNEEGKRTVGIILTCCGILAIGISVIVSVIYFCAQNKSPAINPDDLTRIPATARNGTPDSSGRRSHDRQLQNGVKVNPVPNGATGSRSAPPKHIPGSAEVKLPRQYKKTRHRKNTRHVRRLEEIKEQDAISRKTVGDEYVNEGYENETARSDSFCSEMTLDDQNKIPKLTLHDYDANRPSSSASTSQTSDVSNFRYPENDKSRREIQFLSDSVRYGKPRDIDSENLEGNSQMEEKNRFVDDVSISSGNRFTTQLSTNSSQSDNTLVNSAGGIDMGENGAHTYLPEVPDSDSSIVSYKASHHIELHGEQTPGRISPQIGEPEHVVQVESQTVELETR